MGRGRKYECHFWEKPLLRSFSITCISNLPEHRGQRRARPKVRQIVSSELQLQMGAGHPCPSFPREEKVGQMRPRGRRNAAKRE
jgi:hypothetical protein